MAWWNPTPKPDRIDGLIGVVRALWSKIDQLNALTQTLTGKVNDMANQFDAGIAQLKQDVADMKSVVDGAKKTFDVLEANLAQAIADAKAAGATPEQLQSITDLHTSLAAEKDDLAAVVAANTPAAPAPAPAAQARKGKA